MSAAVARYSSLPNSTSHPQHYVAGTVAGVTSPATRTQSVGHSAGHQYATTSYAQSNTTANASRQPVSSPATAASGARYCAGCPQCKAYAQASYAQSTQGANRGATSVTAPTASSHYASSPHVTAAHYSGHPSAAHTTTNTPRAAGSNGYYTSVPSGAQQTSSQAAMAASYNNRKQPAAYGAVKRAKVGHARRGKPVNLDEMCGVLINGNNPCRRCLTCKQHSVAKKRSVPGRSKPYDELVRLQAMRSGKTSTYATRPPSLPVQPQVDLRLFMHRRFSRYINRRKSTFRSLVAARTPEPLNLNDPEWNANSARQASAITFGETSATATTGGASGASRPRSQSAARQSSSSFPDQHMAQRTPMSTT